MRHTYPTVPTASVHHVAHQTLADTLELKPFRQSVRVGQVLDLLLMMAATARTLSAIARRYFPFSHETARQAVRANLPTLDTLTDRLARALHRVLAGGRRERRRRWTVAIDTHNRPYYGSRATPHIVGGQKKQGTKYFF